MVSPASSGLSITSMNLSKLSLFQKNEYRDYRIYFAGIDKLTLQGDTIYLRIVDFSEVLVSSLAS